MTRALRWLVLAAAALALAGCGGSGVAPPGPPAGDAQAVEVGPMLIRPASAAGLITQALPTPYGSASLVALHGSQINYMASRALLDRFVFGSDRDGHYDIWVCDLDGSHLVQLTDNTADDTLPEWSPDGTRIVFQRLWPGQDTEIITMNADASSITALTDNTVADEGPTWSPDGRSIAFHSSRTTDYEVFRMFEDGSDPVNLTSNAAADMYPDWSRDATDARIVFNSSRAGNLDVFLMDEDGADPTNVTNSPAIAEMLPIWSPDNSLLAFEAMAFGDFEVFLMTPAGGGQRNFSNHAGFDGVPAWSSDGRWVAFATGRTGNRDLWLQEVDAPTSSHQITAHAALDNFPDLGSPTMQTERVLIGPTGSDWGGHDPLWRNAFAGIVAFGDTGYLNFVRIGVAEADLGSLAITPVEDTGEDLAGAVVEANAIVNLKQDAGRGVEPVVWQFGAPGAEALALYFDNVRGRLLAVLVMRDSVYPSQAGAAGALRHRAQGDRLVVEGDLAAIFDAQGRRIAPTGATAVALDADGHISVLD